MYEMGFCNAATADTGQRLQLLACLSDATVLTPPMMRSALDDFHLM